MTAPSQHVSSINPFPCLWNGLATCSDSESTRFMLRNILTHYNILTLILKIGQGQPDNVQSML